MSGQLLARLEGGSKAFLAGTAARLRLIDIETVIERSEDWLMPSSKSWQGLPLRVNDTLGRLRGYVTADSSLTPEAVEHAFARIVDDVGSGRPVAAELVADLVLLRELVHHGALPEVVFI